MALLALIAVAGLAGCDAGGGPPPPPGSPGSSRVYIGGSTSVTTGTTWGR